jgi:aminoglycoside phosphotransferase (APT) family kinase protein
MWFATIDRRGEELLVCVRGDRTDTELTFPLAHEMRFHEVATAHGIKAPKVYGWIDGPEVFVMEAVGGQPDFAGVGVAESDRIVDEYVQELAKLHALPLAPFREADIRHAGPDERPDNIGIARMAQIFREQKVRPNPFLEWVLGWLDRHPLPNNDRQAPIVWDSGQFHHDGANFVSLIDLEIGHLGDPMMDLAGWRMRDSVIPFGDFNRIYDRYAVMTGTPVDHEAIQLHHIAFTISNDLSFSHRLKDPAPSTNYATYLQWCAETNIYATEAIAEYVGAELPEAELPAVTGSRFDAPFQHLARSLRSVTADDEYVAYEVRNAFRLSRHLARVNEIGDVIVAADFDDVAAVLGERPQTWDEAERELERYVLDHANGDRDDDLLWLFHRRNVRAQMLNGPDGSGMAKHNPIQKFSR